MQERTFTPGALIPITDQDSQWQSASWFHVLECRHIPTWTNKINDSFIAKDCKRMFCIHVRGETRLLMDEAEIKDVFFRLSQKKKKTQKLPVHDISNLKLLFPCSAPAHFELLNSVWSFWLKKGVAYQIEWSEGFVCRGREPEVEGRRRRLSSEITTRKSAIVHLVCVIILYTIYECKKMQLRLALRTPSFSNADAVCCMWEDAASNENKQWSFIGSGFISINEWNGFSNEALTRCSENSAEWTGWSIDGDPN